MPTNWKKLRAWALTLALCVSAGGLSGCNKHYTVQRTQAIEPAGGSGLGATRRSRREARHANWQGKGAEDAFGGLLGSGPVLGNPKHGKAKKKPAANSFAGPLGAAPRRPRPQSNPFGTPAKKQGPLTVDDPFKGL